MDMFNGSGSLNDSNYSTQENPDMNSPPPQITPEYQPPVTQKVFSFPKKTPKKKKRPINNYREENLIKDIEKPIIEHYSDVSRLRIIVQYIFIGLLSGCVIWGLTIQFIYGISLGLADDIAILSIIGIMLYYTLKRKSTGGKKFGSYTLCVAFLGFAARGLSGFIDSKKGIKQIGILIARTIILMFCCTLNCNR